MTTQTAGPTPEVRPTRGRRRSRASRPQAAALGAIVAIASLTAAVAGTAAPTGAASIDGLYRGAFVGICGLAGARARRWTLVTAAALVSVGSDGWNLAPAMVALIVSFVLAWQNRRDRVLGGIVGVLVGWAALHLAWPASPTGMTAVLAAAAVLPLWWSAARVARRRTRRIIVRCCVVVVAVVMIAGATAAVFALTQQGALRDAATNTTRAAEAVAAGETSTAAGTFEENADSFDQIARTASTWWMSATRVVPVIAQNVRAVEVAATAGADLNRAAGALASSVDYDELQLEDGSIDLDQLSGFAAPLNETARSTRTADLALTDAAGPWLVGPVADELKVFSTRVGEASVAATIADAAVRELPIMLGAEGPRRYLLLLGNPSEARDLGGHLGIWAELMVTDGKVDVIEVGDAYDLFGPGTEPRPELSDEVDVPASLRDMNPTRFPQNWSATADLRSAAAVAADLYPQRRPGAPLDGVLYADPVAFSALLSLTGPVDTDGVRLEAGNAVEYLTRGQFAGGERSVSGIVREALDRFTDSPLPTPSQLAATFHDVVEDGHLQFVTLDDGGSELLELVELDQPVQATPGADTLMVLNSNANPSKVDAYLRRSIDHQVKWTAATGALDSRVVVTLHNDAPTDGLDPVVLGSVPGAPPGTNRTQLSILSSQELVGVMLDGEQRPWSTRADVGGLTRYSIQVDVPPGGSSNAVFDLRGAIEPGETYRLTWFNQPLVAPDEARLVLTSTDRTFPGGASVGEIELGDERRSDLSITAGD